MCTGLLLCLTAFTLLVMYISSAMLDCSVYTEFHGILNDSHSDEETLLEELYHQGQLYIHGALELCSNNSLSSIWSEQDAAYQQESPSHEIKLWVAPAVTDDSRPEVQGGDSYNSVSAQQVAELVTAVQASVESSCASGISAQVSAEPHSCCVCSFMS